MLEINFCYCIILTPYNVQVHMAVNIPGIQAVSIPWPFVLGHPCFVVLQLPFGQSQDCQSQRSHNLQIKIEIFKQGDEKFLHINDVYVCN